MLPYALWVRNSSRWDDQGGQDPGEGSLGRQTYSGKKCGTLKICFLFANNILYEHIIKSLLYCQLLVSTPTLA